MRPAVGAEYRQAGPGGPRGLKSPCYIVGNPLLDVRLIVVVVVVVFV
jgi:hypothetical protein